MAVTEMATARLILRPRSEAHMPAMLQMAADKEVMRFLQTQVDDDPEAYRQKLLARMRQDDGPGMGFWSLFARAEPNAYLGWVSLHPVPDMPESVELGYRLVRAAWGKGYASEASRAVLHHGFATLDLAEIVGVVNPANLASQAVMVRLGFRLEGPRILYGGERLFYRLENPSATH